MLAVTLGHIESVGVLLQHEANVNTENTQGWTGNNYGIISIKLSNLLVHTIKILILHCSGSRGSWHRKS